MANSGSARPGCLGIIGQIIGGSIAIYVLTAIFLAINGDMGETSRHVLDSPVGVAGYWWDGGVAIWNDFWQLGEHFVRQSSQNYNELFKEADDSSEPIRWLLGVPIYTFVAALQSIVWWIEHGQTADFLLRLVGLSIFIPLLGLAFAKPAYYIIIIIIPRS